MLSQKKALLYITFNFKCVLSGLFIILLLPFILWDAAALELGTVLIIHVQQPHCL